MRKTPLSAPGGSTGREPYAGNSRNRRFSHRGSGYGHFQSEETIVPDRNDTAPQNRGDDFIPLGFSSPVSQQSRNNRAWRGSGNGFKHQSFGGGYHPHRNNAYDTPKSSFNNSFSPRFGKNQRYGGHRNFQKDHREQVDISNYLDLRSIKEDPWADLMKKFIESKSSRSVNSADSVETADMSESSPIVQPSSTLEQLNVTSCSANSSSCTSILVGDLSVKSDNSKLLDVNGVIPELGDDKLEVIKS